jgi:hypothetical protein
MPSWARGNWCRSSPATQAPARTATHSALAPVGLILYTVDGHMSAQLAEPDVGGYISYGGRFSVDEDTSTLHHDVTMSMMPELLAKTQFRHARVDGDLLTLSATRTDDNGVTTHSSLLWRRASPTPLSS